MSNDLWRIESQCPQCGSPVSTEETDHIFKCPYCRVRLYMYLPEGEYFRYYIPAPDERADIFYMPYWRFRGTFFSCPVPITPVDRMEPARYEVTHRLIDSTTLAAENISFPSTLGLRPQVLKLKFAAPDTDAVFLKPRIELKKAAGQIGSGLALMGVSLMNAPPYYDEFIGENISVIYAPFHIKSGMIFDALLDRPVCSISEGDAKALLSGERDPGLKPFFLSTLCPNCGADLDGDSKTLVLTCSSCNRAWHATASGLREMPYSAIASRKDNTSWLPFWKIKADIDGMNIKTHADLIRTANLPELIKDDYNAKEAFFWSPAFKISPPLFLRLSQRLTMMRPEEALFEMGAHMQSVWPVTLPLPEAIEAVMINIANFTCRKNDVFPRLKQMKVRPVANELMYIPFSDTGLELVQPDMKLAINKIAVATGSNL